jgi:nickel/cobalt transporter (NicO) family protein
VPSENHIRTEWSWGHAHAPEPEELAGPGGWRRGLSAVVAVGARPCSGAIIVLIFACAGPVLGRRCLDLWDGNRRRHHGCCRCHDRRRRQVESHSGYGTLALRGIEVGAAVVIIAFGTLLLAGYIVTERMVGI